MLGLSLKVAKMAVHHLDVKHGIRPIKQSQWRFGLELIPRKEVKVNKLIYAGFIGEVKYPTWIRDVLPVKKKNRQIWVCVDFLDLYRACPKDDFLYLYKTHDRCDNGSWSFVFMDGSYGHNQIQLKLEDEELTVFCPPKGIYCYKVFPYGSKNAGATY